MCGRFSRFTGQDVIINRFGINQVRTEIGQSYNIAPTDQVPVIFRENPLVIDNMRWGFIPFYAKSLSQINTPINARDDSLQKNMYKYSIENKRCIIPVDGFYEWKKILGTKQPYYIRLPDKSVFGFGGIYSKWRKNDGDATVYSFAIITTSPNEQMTEIHDRMPLILEKDDEKKWLDPETKIEKVLELVKPFQDELEIYPVSKVVNRPINDSPRNIEPIALDKVGRDESQKALDDFF